MNFLPASSSDGNLQFHNSSSTSCGVCSVPQSDPNTNVSTSSCPVIPGGTEVLAVPADNLSSKQSSPATQKNPRKLQSKRRSNVRSVNLELTGVPTVSPGGRSKNSERSNNNTERKRPSRYVPILPRINNLVRKCPDVDSFKENESNQLDNSTVYDLSRKPTRSQSSTKVKHRMNAQGSTSNFSNCSESSVKIDDSPCNYQLGQVPSSPSLSSPPFITYNPSACNLDRCFNEEKPRELPIGYFGILPNTSPVQQFWQTSPGFIYGQPGLWGLNVNPWMLKYVFDNQQTFNFQESLGVKSTADQLDSDFVSDESHCCDCSRNQIEDEQAMDIIDLAGSSSNDTQQSMSRTPSCAYSGPLTHWSSTKHHDNCNSNETKKLAENVDILDVAENSSVCVDGNNLPDTYDSLLMQTQSLSQDTTITDASETQVYEPVYAADDRYTSNPSTINASPKASDVKEDKSQTLSGSEISEIMNSEIIDSCGESQNDSMEPVREFRRRGNKRQRFRPCSIRRERPKIPDDSDDDTIDVDVLLNKITTKRVDPDLSQILHEIDEEEKTSTLRDNGSPKVVVDAAVDILRRFPTTFLQDLFEDPCDDSRHTYEDAYAAAMSLKDSSQQRESSNGRL